MAARFRAPFFITHGFKENAARNEKDLMREGLSDVSKIFYLEVIDATFSIDGVLGAFAFTMSIPLILIGNGLGAIIVRQLTLGNIERVKRYKYLKNGAMGRVFSAASYRVPPRPSWIGCKPSWECLCRMACGR